MHLNASTLLGLRSKSAVTIRALVLLNPDHLDLMLLEVPPFLYIKQDQVKEVLSAEAVVDIHMGRGQFIRSDKESNRNSFIYNFINPL